MLISSEPSRDQIGPAQGDPPLIQTEGAAPFRGKFVPSGKIARVVGLLTLLVLAYIPLGAVLLNNASAAYFPRQLTVLLLTGAFASLAAAVLWRRRRSFRSQTCATCGSRYSPPWCP